MKVFYRDEQTGPPGISFSPSPSKPALVVARWRQNPAVEICSFEPLCREDLELTHARNFVDGVLDCLIANGFGSKDPRIAATLPFTSGSFYAAARHALTSGENAASPTSGFHHAGYDYSSGFCTFNGLMIAAQKLRQEFPDLRVGILDLDAHYGDGTADIIRCLGLDYLTHYTFGGEKITKATADKWLRLLPDVLQRFEGCEVIFFQAGADPHIDDPLGGVLTTVQMLERDQSVFQC